MPLMRNGAGIACHRNRWLFLGTALGDYGRGGSSWGQRSLVKARFGTTMMRDEYAKAFGLDIEGFSYQRENLTSPTEY